MEEDKQGEGCGTLICLAVICWLVGKFWTYISIGLVALLMAFVVWIEAFFTWQVVSKIFKDSPVSGKQETFWNIVFVLSGLAVGGYMFYLDRDNFFWETFVQMVCFAPALGMFPQFFVDSRTAPNPATRPQRNTRQRQRRTAEPKTSSYTTRDLPNETNHAQKIKDVDFDLGL